jgi:hypothetical protein
MLRTDSLGRRNRDAQEASRLHTKVGSPISGGATMLRRHPAYTQKSDPRYPLRRRVSYSDNGSAHRRPDRLGRRRRGVSYLLGQWLCA